MILSMCFLSSPYDQVNQCVCFARVSIDCVIMFYCHFYFEISFAVIVLIPCLGAFLQHPSLFLSGTSPTGNTQSSTPNEVAMTPPLLSPSSPLLPSLRPPLSVWLCSASPHTSPFTLDQYAGPVGAEGITQDTTSMTTTLRRKDRHGWCAFSHSMKKEPRRRRRDGHRSWTFTDPVRGKTLSVVRVGCTCSGAPAAALRRL